MQKPRTKKRYLRSVHVIVWYMGPDIYEACIKGRPTPFQREKTARRAIAKLLSGMSNVNSRTKICAEVKPFVNIFQETKS